MTETNNWPDGPLHKALVQVLPTFVKEPFSENPRLDIPKLHKHPAIQRSHEAVYKWLRNNRLSTSNATRLCDLANSPENASVLSKLGRTPPDIRYFEQFYLTAR